MNPAHPHLLRPRLRPATGGPPVRLIVWRSGATNLGYVLAAEEGRVVSVDVTNGEELLRVLEFESLTLDAVALTHGHHDHVNGLGEVLEATGCRLLRPEGLEVEGGGEAVSDGERFRLLGLEWRAFDTSGHSPLDFSYHVPALNLCFCGDTVFDGGCGRMFAGPPERLWASVTKVRALPDATGLCCGHDYAPENYLFASRELPGRPEFVALREEAVRVAERGEVRMPVTVEDQKRTNLFWRADDPETVRELGRTGQDPVEVFAALRKKRDRL